MAEDYQSFIQMADELISCYGRPVTIDHQGDTTDSIVAFCGYKEEKLNEWLTVQCWNKAMIAAKNLPWRLERNDLIVDDGVTYRILDPGLIRPGVPDVAYCAKICVDMFDSLINIQGRRIRTPEGGSVDYTEEFTDGSDIAAMIQTKSGSTVFDSVGQELAVTHWFTIPYEVGITSENWVLFDGRRFDIVDIEDLNERKLFQVLRCQETGTETNFNNDIA